MKRVNDRLAKGLPVLPDEVASARAESAREGVRTRKIHEISAAIGADALDASNLLDYEAESFNDDAPDLQEPCTAAAPAFSAAQFLTQTNEDDD